MFGFVQAQNASIFVSVKKKNPFASVHTQSHRADDIFNCQLSNSFLGYRLQKWYVCVLFSGKKLQIFQIIRIANHTILVKYYVQSDDELESNHISGNLCVKICDFRNLL